jgi:enoyl-CoA hydratase
VSEPDALVEQRGHTLIVTLNRPAARNALSTEMMQIMVASWDRVDNDPDIRCCILTGAGGYFCAGMDLKAATAKPPGESFKDGSYDPSRIDALLKGRRLSKPLIAAVEGPAIAGGTEILQGTDIRIAGESAKFGISEARWSLYPMGGSAVRLVRQIPYTVACDLLLTGRHITAAEAKEIGLIRAYRSRRAGVDQGARGCRSHLEQRAGGGAGDSALNPGDRRDARKRGVQDRHPARYPGVPI